MAKPLSEDLRIRAIRAVEGGMSRRAAAERFGISPASAGRFVGEWRERGATRAKPQGGDQRSRRIEAHRDLILGAIKAKPDLTLVEIADMAGRNECWPPTRPPPGSLSFRRRVTRCARPRPRREAALGSRLVGGSIRFDFG